MNGSPVLVHIESTQSQNFYGAIVAKLKDTSSEHWWTNVWWLSGIAAVLTIAISVAVSL